MLDDRDRHILLLLQKDAGMPIAAMAERVALSPSACSRRVQRLRDDGFIDRHVAVLDRKRMGVPTTVFVLVRSGSHSEAWVSAFQRVVQDISSIVEAHRLTGTFDYVLKLILPSIEHYDGVYRQLTRSVELLDVSAYISTDILKFETAIATEFAS